MCVLSADKGRICVSSPTPALCPRLRQALRVRLIFWAALPWEGTQALPTALLSAREGFGSALPPSRSSGGWNLPEQSSELGSLLPSV